jgi:hypothetical protein
MSAFKAKYAGRCAAVGDTILPGDLVVYVDDDLVHLDCEEQGLTERPSAVVCTTCWIEKPCPCEDGL